MRRARFDITWISIPFVRTTTPTLTCLNVGTEDLTLVSGMPSLVFRCPLTGHNVQGWIADEVPASEPGEMFMSLRCTACAQMHLVNPSTAEVLGTGGDAKK
jgi:hypothetical protein